MVFSAPSTVYADDGVQYNFKLDGTINHGEVGSSSDMWVVDDGYYSFYADYYNRFPLVSSVDLQSGYWYSGTLHFWINTGVVNQSITFTMRLSLQDNQASFIQTVTTASTAYGTAVVTFDFDFYVDNSFTCSEVILELSDLNLSTNYSSQVDASFAVTCRSDSQHQTSAIGGFFDGLWKKLSGAFDKIGGWFSALGDRIQGFFTKLVEDIKGLFVPSDGYFDSKQAEISDAMQDHLGMVYQAGSLIDDLIQSVTTGTNKGTITFPTVKFQEYTIIETREIRIIPEGFEFLQTICKTVTTIVVCLAFLNMLRIKFEQFMGAGKNDS